MDHLIAPNASSLQALSEQYRTSTHNLANVNTAGFKRRMNAFSKMLDRQMGMGADGGEETALVRNEQSIDYSQGLLDYTGRSLDLGLTGKGYFMLETPSGPLYTRDGSFRLDANRRLVDAAGRMVAGDKGPIVLPENATPADLVVGDDGTLEVRGEQVGRLRLVGFDDESALRPVGQNAFAAADDLAPGPAEAAVAQGYLEKANVTAVEELVNLMTVTRMYEANTRMIKSQDERIQSILRLAMS